MKKNRLILVLLVVALFASYATSLAFASSPGLYTNPGTISVPGQSTTITLVTPLHGTGNLTVTDPNGNTFTKAISTTNVGPNDWEETWMFPDNFTGASTNKVGTYDVTADLTMKVGRYKWITSFEVVFFVVPDLPFGTIMAVAACFGAFLGYKKLKS